ncbi:uncharacterized protein LOC123552526 [Mercenaria mercenaria]|uniref:uncharacterized protein LOC123552526 n=1 Tax=Mercenaria mercenaria TaxID=6596 RepID=UPI00234FA9FB|nr:uncharacterized protein LOC123552526 [Mercenaria mercenaria]
MCTLNEDQRNVATLALKGHSIFIDGYAGTGKTYLVKNIYNDLTSLGKNVAITCTTGIACMNFDPALNASTIHRWSGLHDGRYSSTEVLAVVSNNETTMNRIKQTDTLIIDEISMLSHKLFDQLHSICSLKDDRKAWGAMQIILSGDFNQLHPTPNKAYNDEGQFCFKSVHFKKFHRLTLNTVVRQSEKQFIDMIRKVSTGMNISEDLCSYIKTFERPINDENSVKLFSKNDLVNRYNRKLLMNQPGDIYEYKATDTGDRSKLQNVRAPGILWIKKNCPVILIRNLSQTLVNGLQGKVVTCEPDGPTVHFPKIKSTLKIKKISFTVFSPKQNQTVANWEQIPLLLSYALTIHKSQGMTLDSVHVDCREIFQPGQLGVAIGRVRSGKGLQVLNFSPKVCFPQPEDITLFKTEPPLVVCDDLSCCRISNS